MIEFIKGGIYSTIQDYPGRVGYWDVGIPPSGPMDSFALKIANMLVNNSEGSACFEFTGFGPTIKFEDDHVIALTGAEMKGNLNGKKIPLWEALEVNSGSELTLEGIKGRGFRTYLAISGEMDVKPYLDSKSTFTFGGFGGYDGRALKSGDRINIVGGKNKLNKLRGRKKLPDKYIPVYKNHWEIDVLPGPHAEPDYFTKEDVDIFYNTNWKVDHNSNRLGYRLKGPDFSFARESGEEGGEHPSNILDYPYAIGTINISGNTPVILTADGPSLGGFVSFATIPSFEIWKVGQIQPNAEIKFNKISLEESEEKRLEFERKLNIIKDLIKYKRN